ncbi:MAG: hypothetical protein WB586_20365 [Chthoniobacterales bacterium]
MNDDYPKATAEEIRAMTNAEFSAYMENLCKAKGIEFAGDNGKRRGEIWTGTWQDDDDKNLSEQDVRSNRLPATGARSAVLLFSLLSTMFSIEASDAERLIKITWSGQVDSDEMRRCAEEIRVTASKMRADFASWRI